MRRSLLALPGAMALGLAVATYVACSLWPGGAFISSDPPGMVRIPGGEFTMGSDDRKARADECPTHRVHVDGFWMDKTVVTNVQFQRFVEATGYITVAERKPDWEELKKQLPPGTPKPSDDVLTAGSGVFQPTKGSAELSDWSEWWRWQPGADWRHPGGPDTSIEGKDNHPVVQVAWEDAVAYAKWAGKRLPTEAEI
jgi:formylglycine-generating enzyme